MAVHRIAFSSPRLKGILEGSTTCALQVEFVAAPGDVLLAGLPAEPPLVKLKVTGYRRQVPFLGLTQRELDRAGIRDAGARADALAEIGSGRNPTVNVIHFRLMKS